MTTQIILKPGELLNELTKSYGFVDEKGRFFKELAVVPAESLASKKGLSVDAVVDKLIEAATQLGTPTEILTGGAMAIGHYFYDCDVTEYHKWLEKAVDLAAA